MSTRGITPDAGTDHNTTTPTLATRTVQAGQTIDAQHRSVSPPIWQTANFRFGEDGAAGTYDYTRSGNPTRGALEEAIVDLEGGAGGAVVGSGMAAVTLLLSLLPTGAHVVCTHDLYGGADRLLRLYQRQGRLSVTFLDLSSPEGSWDDLPERFDLLWIETPSNPLLRVTDLRRARSAASAAGALLAVDNTFLSPVFQQPLDLGADIVFHSTTKYLNGHSDVIGGAVVARTPELAADLAFHANALGLTAAPFDSWLVLRGLRTLHLRCARHASNALAVARWLEGDPRVGPVHYSGLPSHPGHAVASAQQSGHGGMVSFDVVGGESLARAVACSTELFALAESLGGVESLIEHPATMSHAAMDPIAREKAGISGSLLRLSVGIETAADLIADLDRALDRGIGRTQVSAGRSTTAREVEHAGI